MCITNRIGIFRAQCEKEKLAADLEKIEELARSGDIENKERAFEIIDGMIQEKEMSVRRDA